jgi:hypothetical protein
LKNRPSAKSRAGSQSWATINSGKAPTAAVYSSSEKQIRFANSKGVIMPRPNNFILWLVFALGMLPASSAQTPTQTTTASVAGQVKIGDKGIAGAVVSLASAANATSGVNRQRNASFAPPTSGGQAVTDAEGRFQINNVAAGAFRVMVTAPGYVLAGSELTIQVADGQALQNLALTVAKGGVITGNVKHGTRPVIGEPVTLIPVDATGQPVQMRLPGGINFRTDDRGVYRIFGLPAGRYLLSVGRGEVGFGGGGRRAGPNAGGNAWQRTYYPDVLEAAQASALTVEPGQELTGIDIRMAARNTYAIVGRVVDAETGNPMPGVLIGHSKTANPRANRVNPNNPNRAENRPDRQVVVEQEIDAPSNETGEFRIEGLTAGNFTVYAARDRLTGASEFYSDPVPVEIISSDVTGVEIKLLRGASIAGVVAFENPNDPNVQANLPNLLVRASSRNAGRGGGRGGGGGMASEAATQLGPGGTFRLSGLAPGLVTLTLVDRGTSGLTILRMERNGANLQEGLRVEAGEQVAGVRLIATYGNSSIRGVVRVDGGVLPPQLRLTVAARRVDASASVRDRGGRNVQVDASGRFQFDQLVAGSYELTLRVQGAGRNTVAPVTVSVGSGAVQSVSFPLDLKTLTTPPARGNDRQPRGTRP